MFAGSEVAEHFAVFLLKQKNQCAYFYENISETMNINT